MSYSKVEHVEFMSGQLERGSFFRSSGAFSKDGGGSGAGGVNKMKRGQRLAANALRWGGQWEVFPLKRGKTFFPS